MRALTKRVALCATLATTLSVSTPAALATDDALPRGRTAAPIMDGNYPASYFPNTELLGSDEMRITALGTGMPNQTRAAVSIAYLVELGNGDKFLFDIGSGSAERISSLQIPYSFLDKVFIGHLHGDHIGALGELYIGGGLMGRQVPLRIWGPSGPVEELGTAHAMAGMEQMYKWDLAGRVGFVDARGYQLEVNEFDYRAENEVIYDENGVVIRSWPAIHAGDGPVSFALYYNGMKVVFGGDTVPNKWFLEYAADSDVIIHEAMMRPDQWVEFYAQPPQLAWRACCEFHTSPQSFGKIMSTLKPGHAIAYHFFNEEGTRYGVFEGIRETYDGPLSMATDMMVWNVTSDGVTERMAAYTDEAWGVEGTAEQPPPVKGLPNPMSDFIRSGKWKEGYDASNKMLDEHMKKYGLEEQDWRKGYWDE